MADSTSSLRQRKVETASKAGSETPERKLKKKVEEEDAYSPYLDIFRVLTFLFLVSCGFSYLISGGESWFWGMKNPPKYLQKAWWQSQFRGPLYLTPEELAAYDGTDESKPIYLAINGTIYDVSANPRTYGPGGSYHVFAGCDASRAYVTGCFAEDRTPDMRGVEEMFLPLDDPEVDAHWSAEELEALRARERADAERRAHEALKHWVDFFAKSKRYHFVGYVKRPEGWLEKTPIRKLCDVAQNGRSKRKIPDKE